MNLKNLALEQQNICIHVMMSVEHQLAIHILTNQSNANQLYKSGKARIQLLFDFAKSLSEFHTSGGVGKVRTFGQPECDMRVKR